MEVCEVCVCVLLLSTTFLHLSASSAAEGSRCGRIFQTRATGTRKEGHLEFRLRVEGDPEEYRAGTTYRVLLLAQSPAYFRGFTLVSLKDGRDGTADDDFAGLFQIVDNDDTHFLPGCPLAVTESTPRRRTRIQVLWTAPPTGGGCIVLRASIVQKKVVYFQDEGSLTIRLCEKVSGGAKEAPPTNCCACGLAKYRLTFYGNWSEDVHPRDYPQRANHWSALIGATHSRDYVLWEYGGYASEGVRQVAEYGSPVKMEEEIRRQGDLVLSVIKTRAQWPAWQPLNMRSAPSAEFWADSTHPLVSFLTMLGPSPDWNVGLSGEGLCTPHCGWVQRIEADLRPWDAGTDGGVTYESPNQPTVPQEKIRALTSLDHPDSPFYNPVGGAITPLARVVLERIARKGEQCNVVPDTADDIITDVKEEEEEEDTSPSSCLYSPWSPWSSCSSSSCDEGRRMRQRMLKLRLDSGATCSHTQDFQRCTAPGCGQGEVSCMMSEWISWSSCSASCGRGRRSRERFVKQYPEDGTQCQQNTEETEECVVNQHCSPSSCVVTEWAEFGPCSTTCGTGTRIRERMMKMPPPDGSACNSPLAEAEKCMMGDCPVDCMVSDWSNWAECNKSCGRGHTVRTRMIKLEPQFGGQVCPETVQTKRCKIGKCRSKTNMEGKGGGRRRRGKQGRNAAAEPGEIVKQL